MNTPGLLNRLRLVRVPAAFLILTVFVVGCRIEDGPPSQMARVVKNDEIHFDLHPKDGAVVLISSNDVQALRQGASLIIKFPAVACARGKGETREISLNNVLARVYSRHAGGKLDVLGESRPESLFVQSLTSERSLVESRPIQLEVSDVANKCETGCLLVVAVEYGIPISSKEVLGGAAQVSSMSQSTEESTPVEIRLMTGTAVDAVASSADPCSALSPSEASEILGVKMKYREPESGDCTMEPETGAGMPLYYVVVGGTSRFDEKAQQPGAQAAKIGDRAVWLPNSATLWVARSGRTLVLRMGPAGAAPALTPKLKSKAEAIAQKIAAKM